MNDHSTGPTHLGETVPPGRDPCPGSTGHSGGPEPRRWPLLAALVLLVWCACGWSLFVAGITTAPFFGDQPSRAEYLEAGALLVSTLPLGLGAGVLALLQAGRWSLALLLVPPALLAVAGLDLLGRTGDPQDALPDRPVQFTDFFQDAAIVNWVLAALLLAVAATIVLRRRARHTRRVATSTL